VRNHRERSGQQWPQIHHRIHLHMGIPQQRIGLNMPHQRLHPDHRIPHLQPPRWRGALLLLPTDGLSGSGQKDLCRKRLGYKPDDL
jgi:hypothetical protein